jgi:hypothetical protein
LKLTDICWAIRAKRKKNRISWDLNPEPLERTGRIAARMWKRTAGTAAPTWTPLQ